VFLDANVLLAATDGSRGQHETARALIGAGRARGVHAALSGQIVREYLVLATRPTGANGLGLSPEEAHRNVEQFARRLASCEETEAVSLSLRGLVRMHGLHGTSVHDANVVATMRSHGIDTLLTQNTEDFRRYAEIRLMTLDDAATLPDGVPGGG
jgi:predicted nucleic acid-binding protein